MGIMDSRIRYPLGRVSLAADLVWNRIRVRPANFDFELDINKLPIEVTADERRYLSSLNDTWQRNREIRKIISAHMRRSTQERREELFKWIVKTWGGIRGGKDEIFAVWVRELSYFDHARVEGFYVEREKHRPSSWSKILSFADHAQYPTYDARVTVALNIILEGTEVEGRFRMPATRNKKIPEVVTDIKRQLEERFKGRRVTYGYYREYRNLLRAIQKQFNLEDVLEVEMHLFSNSLPIIKEYKAKSRAERS